MMSMTAMSDLRQHITPIRLSDSQCRKPCPCGTPHQQLQGNRMIDSIWISSEMLSVSG